MSQNEVSILKHGGNENQEKEIPLSDDKGSNGYTKIAIMFEVKLEHKPSGSGRVKGRLVIKYLFIAMTALIVLVRIGYHI